jgi:hypothetical protein
MIVNIHVYRSCGGACLRTAMSISLVRHCHPHCHLQSCFLQQRYHQQEQGTIKQPYHAFDFSTFSLKKPFKVIDNVDIVLLTSRNIK